MPGEWREWGEDGCRGDVCGDACESWGEEVLGVHGGARGGSKEFDYLLYCEEAEGGRIGMSGGVEVKKGAVKKSR